MSRRSWSGRRCEGSGVYLGNWFKQARSFIEAHADELAERPTWLFASGSIVGDPPVADDPNALRAGLRETDRHHARARA
jgi:menaquinone-dependent protoporphyrinogen IX oxidase